MPGQTDVVRSKEIRVARWGKGPIRQEFNLNVNVWMIKSDNNPPRSTQIYFRDGCHEHRMMKYHYGKHLVRLVTNSRTNGFINGRPLEKVAIPIQTCGSAPGDGPHRPEYVYRVVHDGHPHGGTKARGFGVPGRETDPLFFQILLQKHLKWTCRELSPFMSVTNHLGKAVRICAFYYARRMTGIRILKIKTSGPGWKHWDMKIWCVEDLVERLGLTQHEYFANEWLIENEIPQQAVVQCTSWEQIIRMAYMGGARAEYLLAKKLYERIKERLARIGKQKRMRERELERIIYGERTRKRARGFSSMSNKRN